MDVLERRAEKRIRPPHDVVEDFALWPAPPCPPPRLPLSVLGPPRASRATGDRLVLADITPIGLGLHIAAKGGGDRCLAEAQALYIHLKLRDYRPQASNGVLSLFLHARVVRAVTLPAELALGLQLTHQGRGSSFEKALELLDVSRFGVPELVAWIDALVRDDRHDRKTPGPGLDLDHLLEEPECAPASTGGQRNAP